MLIIRSRTPYPHHSSSPFFYRRTQIVDLGSFPKDVQSPSPSPPTILWVSKVYGSMKYLGYLTERREFLKKLIDEDPKKLINYLNNLLTPFDIKVLKIIPKRKEDGCYIYFGDPKHTETVYNLMIEKKRFYNVYYVEGSPFLEDLLLEPSTKLILSLNTTRKKSLTEEEAFNLCRPYGKIRDIHLESGKIIVDFLLLSSAIGARNCLHRKPFLDGFIQIKYLKAKPKIKKWLMFSKQPYFYVILLLILLFLFLEPIRLFSVVHTLEKDCIEHDLKTLPGSTIRDDDIEHLIETLTLEPLMILSSPPGSASGILIQRLRESYPLPVWVHCSTGKPGTPLQDNLLGGIASSIGYKPSYNLIHNISTAIGSLLGTKVEAVMASSKEDQLDGILSTLSKALKKLSSKKGIKRKPIIIFQDIHLLTEQEATPEEKAKLNVLLRNLLYWSHRVTVRQGVRVLFVVNTASLERLIDATPNFREVNSYFLKDLSKQKTRDILLQDTISKDGKFEVNKYALSIEDEDFEEMWRIIGGRPQDILLVKKQLKRGKKNIKEIANNMLTHQKQYVLANGFGMSDDLTTPDGKFSKLQLWRVIKLLNEKKNNGVNFNDLVHACGGDSASVVAMCHKGWILISSAHTLEYNQYMAPSPLYAAVYESILSDPSIQKKIRGFEMDARQ